MSRVRLFLAAVVLLLAVPAFAQRFTASIRGTVTDNTGAVVPGATVKLTNQGTGVAREVVTNTAGNYSFADLQVGTYSVEVALQGFKTTVRRDVVVNVADVRDEDFKLETGALTETVSVEADPMAIKTVGAEI
ncbi:MAG TPA: carboxypeptidase-like regulatory domain-containing protein, partial [Vicinamibacteria bacterium]|nr:carboxypeptidase-like regulatory domain-containing protein [Vicinamibacteria bacterium]